MSEAIKSDDIIFNFFKQICDEKDNKKCIDLGNSWISAMKTNINNMNENLEGVDKIKFKEDIKNNMEHLKNLKNKSSQEWREYATKCMIEILENKKV